MGLLDNIKKGIKALAEKTGNTLDKFAKNQEFNSVADKLKLELATRFSKDQLEKVAALESIPLYIQKPKDPYDPFTDFKRVRLRTKVDIAKKVASKLTFNELVEYARKYKIQYKDLEEECERAYLEIFGAKATTENMKDGEIAEAPSREVEATPPPTKGTPQVDSRVEEIVATLYNELGYFLRPVRDEKEFKAQVLSFLVGKFGVDNIREEFSIGGRKVDIVALGDIAIELKIARSAAAMNNLIGEVFKLRNTGMDKIVAVVLDVGRHPNLQSDVAQLKQLGAYVVVIRGQLKKSKTKKIEFRMD